MTTNTGQRGLRGWGEECWGKTVGKGQLEQESLQNIQDNTVGQGIRDIITGVTMGQDSLGRSVWITLPDKLA
jgi:hypothetical protein